MFAPAFQCFAILALGVVASPLHAQSPAPARERLVVSSGWLASHLHDRDLVLLQVGDSADFSKAHIPGARPVTLAQISAGMSGDMNMDHGLMLEMLPIDTLRLRLADLGISDQLPRHRVFRDGPDQPHDARPLHHGVCGTGAVVGAARWRASRVAARETARRIRARAGRHPRPCDGDGAAVAGRERRLGEGTRGAARHCTARRAGCGLLQREPAGRRPAARPHSWCPEPAVRGSLRQPGRAASGVGAGGPVPAGACSPATRWSHTAISDSGRPPCCSRRRRSAIPCGCTTVRFRSGGGGRTCRSRIQAGARRSKAVLPVTAAIVPGAVPERPPLPSSTGNCIASLKAVLPVTAAIVRGLFSNGPHCPRRLAIV